MKPIVIRGQQISLKLLTTEDVTPAYVNWLNDPEVNKYLESRFVTHTLESVKQYVSYANDGKTNFLFGIFLNDGGRHIGNIKVGSVNREHSYADVGLVIGDKTQWGKGIGSQAIALVTDWAFQELKLHKLFAGIYADNPGSTKAFERCGYSHAGLLKKHRMSDKGYVDEILVEKLRDS